MNLYFVANHAVSTTVGVENSNCGEIRVAVRLT